MIMIEKLQKEFLIRKYKIFVRNLILIKNIKIKRSYFKDYVYRDEFIHFKISFQCSLQLTNN